MVRIFHEARINAPAAGLLAEWISMTESAYLLQRSGSTLRLHKIVKFALSRS